MADTFNPDAYLAQAAPSGNPSGVSSGVPVDQTQISQFDPDDFIKQNQIAQASALQSQYGSTPQQVLAGIEGAARGATLGGSDIVEPQLGLTSKEAIAGRAAANPYTSMAGNIAGSVGLSAATGGFGGLAEGISQAAGSGILGGALGTATEGAVFGAGNAVSDTALGDGDVNAQKILSDIGMGAAIGGGLGALSKSIEAVPAFLRTKGTPEIMATGEPVGTGKVPQSLQEMQSAVENAKKYGGQEDLSTLPEKPIAQAAAQDLGPTQQFPVTQMQIDSLDSDAARHDFKTLLDVPGENGDILRNYQNAQKKELTSMLDNTIDQSVSPGYTPTSNSVEAGERAAQAFTDTIEQTRNELAPAFKQIKSTPLADTDHLPGVIDYLTNPASSPYANPKIASMFDTTGDKLAIKPFNSQMGIADTTYSRIKRLVGDLQNNPTDFEGIKNARDALTDKVNLFEDNRASKQLTSAKAAMMDYMQDQVQKVDPDLAVRDTFKKWAINEQNAQLIEKKFGAEIGSNNWRSKATGGDEGILKKIFRDSDSVQAAKSILPEQDFKNMLADHLSILRNDATDNGRFSANKFYSALKRNQYSLGEAFSDDGATYSKINNALTLMRLFPDAAAANPSGTAKTLIQALLNGGIDPFKHVANLVEFGKGKYKEVSQARDINAKLAGQADAAKKLTSIQGILSKVNDKIQSGVTGILSNQAVRSGALSGAVTLSNQKFDRIKEELNKYSSNPQLFMDEQAKNTEALHNAAPSITQGITTTMAKGIQFLQSKLPQPVGQMPLSPKFEPTAAQKTIFSQYYNAVNDPLSALKQVKNATLTNQTMEALQAVHPKLLAELQQKVLNAADLEKMKDLPYAKKLSIAKFLGQPLDNNMTSASITSNQVSFNMPRQSQQSTPQSGRKAPLGGLKQLNFASRAQGAQDNEK